MSKLQKLLLFFILIFFINTNLHSEVVKKLIGNGNDRISLESIAIFGDIELGKDYNPADLNLIIKKLYETNFFSEISAEISDGVLNISVKENPIIKNVKFIGEKTKKFSEQLGQIVSLKEKSSYISNNVKSDLNMIKEFYRQLGFYFVKIDVDVEELTKNRVNIIYTIDKGDKAKIAKIFFLGDKKVREKKLRDIITSQESKFWKVLSRSVYLNQGRVELDKRLLKNYYRNRGYYEVDISSSNVEYSEGEGFVLTYSIDAGKRYRFKKIYAEVDQALNKTEFLSLEKDFSKLAGSYYSQKKLTAVLENIDTLSEQKELQFINHKVSETLDGDTVDVKIIIFEGEKSLIERINIVGNNVTNDSVIRGELLVDEGDPYSVLLVNKSINKIKARNIFGNVESKVLDGSSEDLKVIEINIEEKATGEVIAGAGVGTDGTSFMFSVSENNWLGRGITLKSSLNLSEEKISGDILVENPNYNFSGNSVYASLDLSSTDRAAVSGYESTKTGASLGTTFEQYRNVYLSPYISGAFEDITVDSTASDSVQKMKGNFTNVDLGYSITWDKRNQPFQPTAGYRTRFEQQLPVLQDSSSIINGVKVSKYHAFSEDMIGNLKFLAKSIHGVDDDVRLTNRLFLPSKSLRGFNTRKTGPKDGSDFIGGNYITSLGAEAQLPNLLPETYKTDFSVFLDTANVWSVDYSDSIDDTNEIRSSVGFAANVYTTVGPLSFTVAQSITEGKYDETETFNFRLGTSF